MFRVIIAGGRDFDDYELLVKSVDRWLARVRDDICIVCGKARGADTLGEQYAKERGYPVHYFPADWKKFGKSAGYIRNTEMVQNADALIAFWDGKSLGTRYMIATAEHLGLEVRVVEYENGKGETDV